MTYSPKRELKRFLDEDVGNGDITSKLLEKKKIVAKIITREDAIVAGTKYARDIFALKKCKTKIYKKDGENVKANQTILEIKGNAGDILTCERTALNLLSRMCGIATQTNNLKKQIKSVGSKSKVFATRKTVPGLRFFDKEAVKIGGGEKHRMTLNEMIMIKDNHLAVAKSIEDILRKAKKTRGKIEIEVETEKDAILCAKMDADIIMLDNFSPEKIKKTIKKLTELKLRNKVVLEASGRINSKNITKYAKTNVDMISVGSITNSVNGIDLSLEIS
ncbi:carboxylating nicotinate-nucleotide diphosphorylase [Candidatus Nitrosopelagicus sp.]|nr:carboxylating nicotinate-nucleotide diphosphorylase [Candidatus Nitrosopelagicus sp.]